MWSTWLLYKKISNHKLIHTQKKQNNMSDGTFAGIFFQNIIKPAFGYTQPDETGFVPVYSQAQAICILIAFAAILSCIVKFAGGTREYLKEE